MTRRPHPFAVAGACVVLLVLVYWVALGTARGLAFDRSAFDAFADRPHAYELGSALVLGLDVGSVVLVTVALVGLAVLQRRVVDAASAFAVVACAIGTTEVLKPLLGRLDPLGGDALRGMQASFPSGHTTAAASLGAALLLTAPQRWKPAAAAVAAAYAAAVGIALVAIGSHYPSDVAGGLLVVGAWTGGVLGVAERWRPRPRRVPAPPESLAWVGAVVALGLALAAPLAFYVRGHTAAVVGHRFALAALGIAVLAGCVFTVLAALATRRPSRAAA